MAGFDPRMVLGLEAREPAEQMVPAGLLIRLLEALLSGNSPDRDRMFRDEREARETEIKIRPRVEPLGGA